ncbi:MAG: hypothetical protein R3359_10355 [Marinirhabdus sp.]|nr:hypothetical protein [Marinirhabdus sp.]
MNSIIKKTGLSLVLLALTTSCIISNPDQEDCKVITMKVTKISEGGVKDLVFHNAEGDFYYINRGLENGFTLANAETAVLNKSATLHLAETWLGSNSNHIAQLEVDGKILYTEFNGELEVLANQ